MYRRILLKLSGEALLPEGNHGTLDADMIKKLASTIKELHDKGIQVGVVTGAGNIWRGKLAEQVGIERVNADFMGMMGTVINCVALSSALNAIGVPTKVLNALYPLHDICYMYDVDGAIKALDNNEVVFFAGGTGKPFFTTDTTATMRALETKCDAIFMAKHGVDGIYDKDPVHNKDAKFLKDLTFDEVIERQLKVMDQSAIELIKDTDLVIKVFSMQNTDNIIRVVFGEDIGSTVKKEK
jgi:uridylate kinase